MNTVEEFYAAIGYGGVSLSKIMPRIKNDLSCKQYRTAEAEKPPKVVPKLGRRSARCPAA
ncbi:MAG: hypothetical protein V8Q30_07770 [Acutalibacteraceae bacterium]